MSKKNNLFMLIASTIGYKNINTPEHIIIKSLEKCLLFHFFVSDLKDKDKREYYKNSDSITYRAGGKFIEASVKKLLKSPKNISCKITKELFPRLLLDLFESTNNPYIRKLENGKNRNDKRRSLKFFEKTLMFYYYKTRIPTKMLENDFSIEHICPNSCNWDGELDKDRTGNLFPIISSINCSRGNNHIKNYKTTKAGVDFFKYVGDISHGKYDNIIDHDGKKPKIKDNDLYNNMCEKNEKRYIDCFIKCLFD